MPEKKKEREISIEIDERSTFPLCTPLSSKADIALKQMASSSSASLREWKCRAWVWFQPFCVLPIDMPYMVQCLKEWNSGMLIPRDHDRENIQVGKGLWESHTITWGRLTILRFLLPKVTQRSIMSKSVHQYIHSSHERLLSNLMNVSTNIYKEEEK